MAGTHVGVDDHSSCSGAAPSRDVDLARTTRVTVLAEGGDAAESHVTVHDDADIAGHGQVELTDSDLRVDPSTIAAEVDVAQVDREVPDRERVLAMDARDGARVIVRIADPAVEWYVDHAEGTDDEHEGEPECDEASRPAEPRAEHQRD